MSLTYSSTNCISVIIKNEDYWTYDIKLYSTGGYMNFSVYILARQGNIWLFHYAAANIPVISKMRIYGQLIKPTAQTA